jgi:TonB family protein
VIGRRILGGVALCGAIAFLVGATMLWRQQQRRELAVVQPEAAKLIDSRTGPAQDGGNGSVKALPAPPWAPVEKPVVRATPFGSPGEWLSDQDYPVEAQQKEWEGTAAFTLAIGYAGLVDSCRITQSTGHQVLDEATCRVLTMRARFTPARDAKDETARDTYSGRITWRLAD